MNIQTVLRLLINSHQLRGRDRWTHPQLEAYQTHALEDLRTFVYQRSPFYQRFHKGLFDRPLHELPILTKKIMMEHFDELVTDRTIRLADIRKQMEQASDLPYLGSYWVNATSGSTGSPGIFLFNQYEWAMVLTSFARGYDWAGSHVNLLHQQKIAVVSSVTPWHMSALVGTMLRSPWVSTLRLSALEPIESILNQLNERQPEILVASASMARILAVEQLDKRLQIAPHTIFTSSEVLTDETRRLIEAAWGKRLFNQYAATETAGIAAECQQHNGMHLYEDLMIVENVDAQNQPVPLGVYGDKLLVTVLFNRTQPLIRYELDDSMRFADKDCPCGRPYRLVDNVQGRTEDTLHFPSGAAGQVAIHPNLFHEVMEGVSTGEWQIIHRDDGLHVLLDDTQKTTIADQELVERLGRALAKQWVIVPQIYVEHVAAIPRTPNGKMLLIKSENTSTIVPFPPKRLGKPVEPHPQKEIREVSSFKWIAAALVLAVLFTATLYLPRGTNRTVISAQFPDIHGLGFSADGQRLFVPAHNGLLVYTDGHWETSDLPSNDYMGYTPTNSGFYSSGHPGPQSDLPNPLGLIRSREGASTLEMLAFEGESDFHLLGAGYQTHTLYALNGHPNSRLSRGLYYTLDDGQTWEQSNMQGGGGSPLQIAVHPTEAGTLAIATEDGVFLSMDYGNTFALTGEAAHITAAVFNPNGETLLMGFQTITSYDLASGQMEAIQGPNIEEGDTISYIAVNQVTGEIAVATFDKNIYLSQGNLPSWQRIVTLGVGQNG
ncbi:MAG: F510_1955 family glycosylhydrolase [Chloroflexota bacterium]